MPALIQSHQPKIGDPTKTALGFVAGIGGGLLKFMASFIVAGIIMAFGQSGGRNMESIFARIFGTERGGEFAKLSTATIRPVAQGVIGVAFIQAIVVGLALLVAGFPWAGVLSVIVLVLGIAQVPAVLVTLPAIGYIWTSGDYGNLAAITYTAALFLAGMTDNVLKPLMLGRGVDAPMPIILIGALGGDGGRRYPWDVRRCYPTCPWLSGLHELGGKQTGRASHSFRTRLAISKLNQ